MNINENKGQTIGGLIGGAVNNKKKPSDSGTQKTSAKKADPDKLNNLASDIAGKVESNFNENQTTKSRKRKLKVDFFATSARFRKDLYQKMLDHEEQNFMPLVHQYNKAIEFWFAKGCPIGDPQK